MTWLRDGWQVFGADPVVADWAEATRAPALRAASDPEQQRQWLRHGGTWFVGVDALSNDPKGRVGDGPALGGAALAEALRVSGIGDLHPAQISVTYPGYPQRDPDETDAAFRYRKTRDGAHLDGLKPVGPNKRRHLQEPHAWILGLPLTQADPQAAPLVVWEGSPEIMRAGFRAAFAGIAPSDWSGVDVTEVYQKARAQVFETCRRVEIAAKPGEAILLHRLAIHGIAPWANGARAATEGRVIAYFRPCFRDLEKWLSAP